MRDNVHNTVEVKGIEFEYVDRVLKERCPNLEYTKDTGQIRGEVKYA